MYISIRPYAKEMLARLSDSFELVLFSAQTREYTDKLAKILTLDNRNPNNSVFHQVLCKDECIKVEEAEIRVSDLEILYKYRNIKDIIIVSYSCRRYMKHLRNGIPSREYNGNKKDFMLVALERYLKTFIKVKDVRDKL
jgi:CTD small phosphatase-like protein 2